MRTFFVTLNWNTTELLKKMVTSVEKTTPEPHTWVILDNGSTAAELDALHEYLADTFEPWQAVLIEEPANLGCVLGHNKCFDAVQQLANEEPYEIVMMDTDVEVYQAHWLRDVHRFIDSIGDIGIVGLEHSKAEVCAAAVGLDKFGNWYTHEEQMQSKTPVLAESVGLGMAVLRPPVSSLRFDTGFKLYYKQDDDLCFQARIDHKLKIYAYPIDMVHWGSGALRVNQYNVGDAHGWDEFDQVKQDNQRYFAAKWANWLDNRRATTADEIRRLIAQREKLLNE